MNLPNRRFSFKAIISRLQTNPIAHAEYLHSKRINLAGNRLRIGWMMVIALIAGIGTQIATTLAQPIASATQVPLFDIERFLEQASEFAAVATAGLLLIHNLIISGIAGRLAAGTIAREKQGHTWEALILTAISARRIVSGKWWAVMEVLWQRHRFALLMRGVLALWLIAAADIRGLAMEPSLKDALLVIVLIIVIPLVNGTFSGAVGIFGSALVSSEAAAARINGFLQVGVLFGMFGCACITAPFLFSATEGTIPLLLAALVFTAIDGGLISLLALALSTPDTHDLAIYLGGVGIWVVLYSALSGLALWATARILARQGAILV